MYNRDVAPEPWQVRRACLEIQRGWSDKERKIRRLHGELRSRWVWNIVASSPRSIASKELLTTWQECLFDKTRLGSTVCRQRANPLETVQAT